MSSITRSWLSLAAVGTGLIHVALVTNAPLPWAIILAVLGVAEFGWGVLSFARESVLAPRVAIVVAISPVLGWALLSVVSTSSGSPATVASLGVLPLAVASLFELFIAAVLGAHLRRRATDDAPPAPRPGRYAVGLAAAVLVIAGLTAPALAAVQGGTPPPTPAPDIHGH